jgi:hypothetical protein
MELGGVRNVGQLIPLFVGVRGLALGVARGFEGRGFGRVGVRWAWVDRVCGSV